MKLKLLSFLVAVLAVMMLLASCDFGGQGQGQGGGGETIKGDDKYPWKSAEILVQLYGNTANNELSSGLKRYYAGTDSGAFEEIDTLVRERNTMAKGKTKVDAKYSYEDGLGWGASIDTIQTLAKSGTASAPDVYCNFAYDMTSCALRGCFANLLANTNKSTSTMVGGGNFFKFAEDGYVGTSENYFDSNAGQGYFFDYMQSLAFKNAQGKYDKLYCLASNYCTDLVRAFLVVPVNINMLEEISVDASTGDRNNDGKFDLTDFYTDVWAYKWTYDSLATLSQAVYKNTNSAVPGADIMDTLGFACGKGSGLSGSGILYTTSVQIIREVKNADGTTTYAYPETNDDLVALSDALSKLFGDNSGKGICTIDSKAAEAAGYKTGDLEGIRSRFSEDKVLFGGVIAVGSLEDDVYQKMNAGKGFGIVPVPLYTQRYDAEGNALKYNKADPKAGGEQYLTLVHNIARIVAIGIGTTEFAQCTAFLDYQSQNSADILEKYYKEDLTAKVEGGEAGEHNKEMLNYIRNHVRDCFDKTYEDVISNYQKKNDQEADRKRWHMILYSAGYIVSDMDRLYASYHAEKQLLLDTVLAEWAALQ